MSYRALAIPVVGAILVGSGFLAFGNLNDNLVYYLTPDEALAQRSDFSGGQRLRLGGFVKKGSVVRGENSVTFVVSGGGGEVAVVHTGSPSQMFRAGIGVVVEGAWRGTTFYSDTMLIKHGSEYRPPGSASESPDPEGSP